MNERYLHLSSELEKKNIRPSHQRLKILEYFHNNKNHPTVDDIYKDLKPRVPTLTKATIYNNLKLFVESQLIIEVHIEENEVRYELMSKRHGHFKCTECGEIFDFSVEIDSIPSDGLSGFKINDKDVYFRGVCPECLSKINEK